MARKKTVLVIPPNDPEAVMITEIARALGIPMILSDQPHGASLDKELDITDRIRESGAKRAIVVEMPGPGTEARVRKLGIELVLIDHHRYTGLDRAVDPKTGNLLPSSLEQFLKLFRVTDKKLAALGFDPKLVRAIGLMDRGYVWALRDEGYGEADIRRVLDEQRRLMATVRDLSGDTQKEELARDAWKRRKEWGSFIIVADGHPIEIRSRISLIVALELKQPTPLIIVEEARGFIYVQESDYALELFKKFGGFTFGMDRNWGYRNQSGKPQVGLGDVKKFLAHME